MRVGYDKVSPRLMPSLFCSCPFVLLLSSKFKDTKPSAEAGQMLVLCSWTSQPPESATKQISFLYKLLGLWYSSIATEKEL
jgi:hypothetical protein